MEKVPDREVEIVIDLDAIRAEHEQGQAGWNQQYDDIEDLLAEIERLKREIKAINKDRSEMAGEFLRRAYS